MLEYLKHLKVIDLNGTSDNTAYTLLAYAAPFGTLLPIGQNVVYA